MAIFTFYHWKYCVYGQFSNVTREMYLLSSSSQVRLYWHSISHPLSGIPSNAETLRSLKIPTHAQLFMNIRHGMLLPEFSNNVYHIYDIDDRVKVSARRACGTHFFAHSHIVRAAAVPRVAIQFARFCIVRVRCCPRHPRDASIMCTSLTQYRIINRRLRTEYTLVNVAFMAFS